MVAGHYATGMGDFNDTPELVHAYTLGYYAGRQVAEDMGESVEHAARNFPDPTAEALKRVARWWDVPTGTPGAKAVADGIDDGLNGRRPRY